MVAATETTRSVSQAVAAPAPPQGSPYISFPLSADNIIEIRLRRKVSPEDFERIKMLVELSKASLVGEE